MVRPSCCDMQNVRNGPWNRTGIPKKTDFKRCGKNCRLRRTNHQGFDTKHESFTPEEEELVIKMHSAIGSRWSIIAQQLPGRTDNDVKNLWNTKLRKMLSGMGVDPVTHKPFSQILADYGSINQTLNQNPKTQIGSLNRDLKHAFGLPKPDQDNPSPNTNHCFGPTDLFSQLQVIKFVSEASNWVKQEISSPDFFYGSSLTLPPTSSSSSSSSSSSTHSHAGQENAAGNFSWRDFLLDEEIFQENQQAPEEQGTVVEFSSKTITTTTSSHSQNVIAQDNHTKKNNSGSVQGIIPNGGQNSSNGFTASTSTDSFVGAILDKENEMFLGFPESFEALFYD